MKIKQIINELALEVIVPPRGDYEVQSGYTGDLLSQVVARADRDFIWITIQNHLNVIAVACLLNLAGVILAEGIEPIPEAVEKAREEGVCLLSSPEGSFELGGKLYQLFNVEVESCYT
ncbi:MAG: iron-sulfur binding hydrogenase [Clostridia bacterium]|nr:iron-sulfur binding hydrogenase [Clostridia bacterium]